MNENIDLTKILKDCPKWTKFYSTLYGEVAFDKINKECEYPIAFVTSNNSNDDVTADGRPYKLYHGECTLFPSRDQRDWSKFTAPWLNKESEKFDPHTLRPFDKVIARKDSEDYWDIDFFSCFKLKELPFCISGFKCDVIPYNDDTKHLVGTMDDVPDFYKYWED